MTDFVLWWGVLIALALLGVPLNRWRRDIAARQAAEARAEGAQHRLDAETTRADIAEQHAREWAAATDAAYAELQRHLATCLGSRITFDSERRN